MTPFCALQGLQAQLCAEQEASAKKEGELQDVHCQRVALAAQLAHAEGAGAETQSQGSPGSEPPLMLPAPSDPQVCPLPGHTTNAKRQASHSLSITQLLWANATNQTPTWVSYRASTAACNPSLE